MIFSFSTFHNIKTSFNVLDDFSLHFGFLGTKDIEKEMIFQWFRIDEFS